MAKCPCQNMHISHPGGRICALPAVLADIHEKSAIFAHQTTWKLRVMYFIANSVCYVCTYGCDKHWILWVIWQECKLVCHRCAKSACTRGSCECAISSRTLCTQCEPFQPGTSTVLSSLLVELSVFQAQPDCVCTGLNPASAIFSTTQHKSSGAKHYLILLRQKQWADYRNALAHCELACISALCYCTHASCMYLFDCELLVPSSLL